MRKTILIAEDTEGDRVLLRLGLEGEALPFSFRFVGDGQEAVEYLEGLGPFGDRARFPLPSLLITDIKMPRMDGLELLAWLRAQEAWKRLPVIVWTSSDLAQDREIAERCGATAYVVKTYRIIPPTELVKAIRECTGVQGWHRDGPARPARWHAGK